MVRLVGSRPLLRKNYKTLPFFWIIFFSLGVVGASAEALWAFNQDRTLPRNAALLKDNWSNSRSNPGCFPGRGRAFDISINNLPTSFEAINLEGISVLVYVPASSVNLFDGRVFRLTLLNGAKEQWFEKDLSSVVRDQGVSAVTDVNVHPGYKVNISDRYYTYEIFFKLTPLLIKRGSLYTAILECLSPDSQNIYSVWESQKLGGIGATAAFDGTHIVPYGAIAGIQHSLFGKKALLYRPVVLIHDFGGKVEDFTESGYMDLLSGSDFDARFVKFFDYGTDTSGYRSFADVKILTPKFTDDLKSLSAEYTKEGGDGKVDVVAFGLGNFIVKDYLAKNGKQGKISKFIAVGSPDRGSWLADFDQNAGSATSLPPTFNRKIADLFAPNLRRLNVLSSGRPPPANSFLDQAKSNSPIVRELADTSRFPLKEDVRYFNIAADIRIQVKQVFLDGTVTGKSSLGDGYVLPEHVGVMCDSSDNNCSTVLTEDAAIKRTVTRLTSDVRPSLDVPDVGSFKLLHNRLLGLETVKNKIKEMLSLR